MTKVAILCGGRGTRIVRGDDSSPKPLVDVGGKPIVWHVMSIYAEQGFSDFLLLTGWQGDRVEAAVAEFAEVAAGQWNVTCLDTGVDTPTGGRVHAAREQLSSDTFALTYADGVADIDLRKELAEHRAQKAAATMAVVRPLSPWGKATIGNDGRVTGFVEKPRLESWINGGFFFLEPRALAEIGPDDVLEERPLAALAANSELHAFKHEGFWDCMDTFKDAVLLNELCAGGSPPWRQSFGDGLAGAENTAADHADLSTGKQVVR